MRLTATRTSVTSAGGASDALYSAAGGKPTLDQRFAKDKSLKDKISGKDLITFSRASSGTYVDSDGLIKTTPVNLVYPSESIDDGVGLWTTTSSSGTISVTPNFTESPYGTNTATRVVATKSGNGYGVIQARPNIPSTPGVGSIWIKSNTGSNQTIYFRLDLGGTEDYNLTVTPEWQRYQMVEDEAAGPTYLSVGLRGGSDNSCDISIWGAQVQEGALTDYIPTGATISGAPRFDHDPLNGESLGLLIEEERTNLVPYSEDISSWGKTNVSVSSESVSNPFGFSNVYRVRGSSTLNRDHLIFPNPNLQLSANTIHTTSAYVKGEGTGSDAGKIQIRIDGIGYRVGVVNFDLFSNLTSTPAGLSGTSSTGNTWSIDDYGIEFIGDGWYRIWMTHQSASVSTVNFLNIATLNAKDSNSLNRRYWYVASGTGGFYFVGAQVEQGSFPTSIIPTTGSSVTRSADIVTIEGNDFAKTNLLSYSERFENWNLLNVDVTPNVSETTAPDGTYTADKHTFNLSDGSMGLAVAGNGLFTFSVYAKYSGTTNFLRMVMGTSVWFDVTNGVVGTQQTGLTGNIVAVGNGWFRCSVTGNKNFSKVESFASSNNGSTVEGVGNGLYIWGAQLEEGDELTEYTPSVETFVSRASSATYVDDATGLIKTTPVNLFKQSQNFTNNLWQKQSGSLSTTSISGPLDTSTVYKWEANNAPSYLLQDISGSVLLPNVNYTQSFFVKADSSNFVQIATSSGFTQGRVNFELTGAGTVGSNSTGGTASIEKIGDNGWYRIKVTAIRVGTPNNARMLLSVAASLTTSRLGSSSGSVYIWGAQIEEGTTATPYIKTGSTISGAARYENGELLLEPARTNFTYQSDTVGGNSLGSTIIVTLENNVVSPRGVAEQVRKLERGSGNSVWRFGGANLGATDTNYAVSFWVKAASGASSNFFLDINDRTPISTNGVGQNVTDEWQRFVAIGGFRGDNPGHRFADINLTTFSNPIYIWGAQIEEAEFATSYIPTGASYVTRAADVSTSALGVDSWYNQSEGTAFVDWHKSWSGSFTSFKPIFKTYNTGGNPATITWGGQTNAGNGVQIYYTVINSSGANLLSYISYDVYDSNSDFKAAFALATNDASVAAGGITRGTDTSVSVPTMQKASFDKTNFHISRLAYFPTRKTDQQLIDLTTDNRVYSYGRAITNYPHDLGTSPGRINRYIDLENEYFANAEYDLD